MTILECDGQIRLSKDLEKRIKAQAAKVGNVAPDIKTWDDLWEAMCDMHSDEELLEVLDMLDVPVDDLKAELKENDMDES